MAKKRGKKKRRPESESSTIRPDLQQIIKTVFPDDLVEFPADCEGDELDELHDTVRQKLAALTGVRVVESAAPSDDSRWDTYDDDDDDGFFPESHSGEEFTYSYRRYFVAFKDPEYRISGHIEEQDVDGQWVKVDTTERLGCLVALCLFAPVALVNLESMEESEDWADALPDVSRCMFEEDGTPVDMEAYLCEVFGSEAVERVRKLREAIIGDLESAGITVIPDQEANQAVPWLEAGEDLMQINFDMEDPITVKEAFFFLTP
jgi:hypothetical protein